MSDSVERVSFTLPESLVDDLDAVVAEWEYSSRSKAARDAFRLFLAEHRWEGGLDRPQRGAITIVYDHHAPGVNDALLEIQHEVADVIVATQHVHFDADRCLESVLVDGPGREIRELVNELKSLDGTKQVQFTAV